MDELMGCNERGMEKGNEKEKRKTTSVEVIHATKIVMVMHRK